MAKAMEFGHLLGIGLSPVAVPACTVRFQGESAPDGAGPASVVACYQGQGPPSAAAGAARRGVRGPSFCLVSGPVHVEFEEDESADPAWDAWEEPEASSYARRGQACRGARRGASMPAFLELPDLVETVGEACCEPRLLARLGMTSRNLRAVVADRGFALRRCEEMRGRGAEWAQGCTSLELLALGLQVHELCARDSKNHLYFPYGGGTNIRAVTMHLVDGAAAVAKRFPRVRLHVDAHTGAGAPVSIARNVSMRRARAVMQALASRGADERRLSSAAWGRQLALVWSDPEDDTAARAEVYFCMDGHEFPPRPSHYGLVPEPPAQVMGVDPEDQAACEEFEADFHRRLSNLRQSFVARPGGLLQGFFRRLPGSRGGGGWGAGVDLQGSTATSL